MKGKEIKELNDKFNKLNGAQLSRRFKHYNHFYSAFLNDLNQLRLFSNKNHKTACYYCSDNQFNLGFKFQNSPRYYCYKCFKQYFELLEKHEIILTELGEYYKKLKELWLKNKDEVERNILVGAV